MLQGKKLFGFKHPSFLPAIASHWDTAFSLRHCSHLGIMVAAAWLTDRMVQGKQAWRLCLGYPAPIARLLSGMSYLRTELPPLVAVLYVELPHAHWIATTLFSSIPSDFSQEFLTISENLSCFRAHLRMHWTHVLSYQFQSLGKTTEISRCTQFTILDPKLFCKIQVNVIFVKKSALEFFIYMFLFLSVHSAIYLSFCLCTHKGRNVWNSFFFFLEFF